MDMWVKSTTEASQTYNASRTTMIGCRNLSGRVCTSTVMSQTNSNPPKTCYSYGSSWYLPSVGEYAKINSAGLKVSGTHWTSEGGNSAYALGTDASGACSSNDNLPVCMYRYTTSCSFNWVESLYSFQCAWRP